MIKIRKFQKEDEEQVIKLVSEVLKEIFEKVKNLEELENINSFYSVFYVAENNQEIIGTIALKDEGNNIGKLRRFYVKKEYRNKGIGKKLLKKLIEFSIKNNFNKIVLSTYKVMKDAIDFYRKNGFEETSIEDYPPSHKLDKNNLLFFQKTLK